MLIAITEYQLKNTPKFLLDHFLTEKLWSGSSFFIDHFNKEEKNSQVFSFALQVGFPTNVYFQSVDDLISFKNQCKPCKNHSIFW